MSKHYNHPLINKYSAHKSSGIVFIGSVSDPFHMIIRCPIHVFCSIKKAFSIMPNPPMLSFFSGSVPISDLAMHQFIGKFKYLSPSGKKQSFDAAFIYPTCCAQNECDINPVLTILQVFRYHKYEFYNKKNNKGLEAIVAENFPCTIFSNNPFFESDFLSCFGASAHEA